MDGALQGVIRPLRRGLATVQPGADGRQVAGRLCGQDLQQHRIDRSRDGPLLLRRRDGLRHDAWRQSRSPRRRSLDGLDDSHWFVAHFLARGDALGDGFDGSQVRGHGAGPRQRGTELRQDLVCLPDQRHDRRTGVAAAVEHAVEHVLDLPAELAQRARTDQAPAALEGVEDAADRTHLLAVIGRLAPTVQQAAEVRHLLVEFLEEDLADVIVDVGAVFEATGQGTVAGRRGGHCRNHRLRLCSGRGHRCRRLFDGLRLRHLRQRDHRSGLVRQVHPQRGRGGVALGKADR